jgi:hypothetical protein
MKAPKIYILPPVLRHQNVLRQLLSSSGVAYLTLDSCDMDLRARALMTLLHQLGSCGAYREPSLNGEGIDVGEEAGVCSFSCTGQHAPGTAD